MLPGALVFSEQLAILMSSNDGTWDNSMKYTSADDLGKEFAEGLAKLGTNSMKYILSGDFGKEFGKSSRLIRIQLLATLSEILQKTPQVQPSTLS